MLKTFFRDSVIYALPSIVSRGLAVILIPLYTRVLSPADYGSFDLLSAFAVLINLTVALEVSQGVARFYSDEQDPERRVAYASSAFWFTIFCYALFLGITLFFNKELSLYVMGRNGMEAAFQVGVSYIFLNGIFYLMQNQFRWELRSAHYAIVSLAVTVITAALAVILTYVWAWGLVGLLSGMAGGALVGCFYGLWNLRKSFRFQFQRDRLTEMLAFSVPLVPSGVAVFMSQYIDRLMINHYLALSDVGLFGIAFRVAGMVGLVIVGFQSALTPLIYAHYRNPETPAQLARIFRIFIAFSLLLFFSVSVFAKEIMMVLTIPAYYDAAHIVVLLIPAILLSNMYIFAPGTAIEKKTNIILWINVCGAALNILLNTILIPFLGIEGASIAKLISYALVFGMYMWFSQKLYYVPHNWMSLAQASFVVGMIAFGITRINLSFGHMLALKIAGIAIVILIIFKTGVVRLVELQKLQAIIQKRFLKTE